jgi:hypothetical protein
MKSVKLHAALFLGLALVAAPVLAQKVHIDYDRSADFDSYSTYAWYETSDTSVADSNELMHRRIIEIIEAQVSADMTKVDSDPDVYVTYHTEEKEEMSLDTTHFGYGYPSGWAWDPYWGGWGGGGMGSSTTSVYTYTRGTLIIDIWDAKTQQLVWRGSANDIVPENPQKLERKLEKAVAKIAKKWDKMYRKG